MRAVAVTAYRENYGAHNWDGEGDCPQYWNNKGNEEYAVEIDDSVFAKMTDTQADVTLDALVKKATYSNQFATETLVDRGLYPSGCRTPLEDEFERFLKMNITTEDERRYYRPKAIHLADIGVCIASDIGSRSLLVSVQA